MGSMDYCLVENTLSEIKRIQKKLYDCQKFSKSEATKLKSMINVMYDILSNFDLIDYDNQSLDEEACNDFIEQLYDSDNY